MSYIVVNAHKYKGQVVDNGHCVRFLQVVGNIPHTSSWRRGMKCRGATLPIGVCIATFSEDGKYENRTDGESHAAIFIDEVEEGLVVWDQWIGHPVAQRTIRFKGGQGSDGNDGDQYYVIV